jgi:3'-phosphoadenosine 5'-phosphosulfate sulfotransferase (PAPS reductase)/FAD synthetase
MALGAEPLLVFFSTGKDSVVMLDLLMQHHSGPRRYFYMYFMAVRPSTERLLSWYEHHYSITIERIPDESTRSVASGKKVRLADIESELRAETDYSYIAQGVRRDESMARRGMLAKTANGIDSRNLKFYPIADVKAKEALAYCKLHRLPLPVEYSYGLDHEISAPDGELLMLLKHNMPEDYKAIADAWPGAEAATKKAMWYGSK